MNYNEKHPELQKGEMFLANAMDEDFRCIGWKSKRKGNRAYTKNGEVIMYKFPVFIQIEEFEAGRVGQGEQ